MHLHFVPGILWLDKRHHLDALEPRFTQHFFVLQASLSLLDKQMWVESGGPCATALGRWRVTE